ncbi:MAG: glutamine synthetase type III, partial [Clostridia bacterium]|nr:glutamine synthetase type III [Clostridia bacterium]
DFHKELHTLLAEIIKKHKRIIFNGNGYGDEWIEEAKKRGLPNINNSVDSYAPFIAPESIRVFEKHHVYTETELRARYEIKLEKYTKIVSIEANTLLQMINRQIMPACLRFADETARTIVNIKAAGCDIMPAEESLHMLTNKISMLYKATKKLEKAVEKSDRFGDDYIAQAKFSRDSLVTAMCEIRKYADELEMIVEKDFWPIPTYDDLIYSV